MSVAVEQPQAESDDERLKIGDATLHRGDCLEIMRRLPDDCFDLAIVDPPYGASTTAQWSLPKDHGLRGFGGSWRLADHRWDLLSGGASLGFTLSWMSEVKRLVRPTGSVWVHGTYHNSGFANVAAQMLGLEIINEVVWFKRNAFPNLSARRLTASHETILWMHTSSGGREYAFNYDAVREADFPGDSLKQAGKQLRTVWDIPNNKSKIERAHGSHPTQKPLKLTNRLLAVAGTPGGSVLVPFAGSGTEMVAALQYGMSPTGIEIEPQWCDLAEARVRAAAAEPALPLDS